MKTIPAAPFASVFGDDGGSLISLADLQVGGELTTSDEDFDSLITSSSFLPRVQLFGANSNAVTEEKIGLGRFGLVKSKDDIEDLGKTLECLPIAWRFKAMQIADGEVVSNYDHESDEFKRIQAESEETDSGAMYGIEFLLWIPDISGYATYFLSSKSSRREAKPLRALLGKAASIEANLVKTKKYAWHAPKVSSSATPFTNIPDGESVRAELEKFKNPSSSKTEGTTDEEEKAVDGSRR